MTETASHIQLRRTVANGLEFTGENTSYVGLQVYLPSTVESVEIVTGMYRHVPVSYILYIIFYIFIVY